MANGPLRGLPGVWSILSLAGRGYLGRRDKRCLFPYGQTKSNCVVIAGPKRTSTKLMGAFVTESVAPSSGRRSVRRTHPPNEENPKASISTLKRPSAPDVTVVGCSVTGSAGPVQPGS